MFLLVTVAISVTVLLIFEKKVDSERRNELFEGPPALPIYTSFKWVSYWSSRAFGT